MWENYRQLWIGAAISEQPLIWLGFHLFFSLQTVISLYLLAREVHASLFKKKRKAIPMESLFSLRFLEARAATKLDRRNALAGWLILSMVYLAFFVFR